MRSVLDCLRGPIGAVALLAVTGVIFLAVEFEWLTGTPRSLKEWEFDETFSLLVIMSLSMAVLVLLNAKRDLELAQQKTVASEARAQQIALHDPLTGLPNRRCFHQHVENMLAQTKPGDKERAMTVLLFDLDRFKPVNDLRGHEAGDLLLCELANRLRRICPEGALMVRLGGDEFVVALEGAEAANQGVTLARRILTMVAEPFHFGDWSATISCSIGIANLVEGMSSSDLLRRADQAMYSAKQAGRATYSHYDEALGQALSERAALELDLRRAVDQDEIVPFFQPIYDISGRELRGFEVLARWPDPVRGFVPPDIFIDLAEEIGLVDRLSDQVLDQACAALAGRPTQLPISFNLSPRQLGDLGLPRRILSIIARHGIPGSRFEVEITECAVLGDIAIARRVIGELRAEGVRISLDHFGTGTSSPALLMQLSIHKVKIDRSFIAEVDRSCDKAKIVSALLALAQALELDVTAEGIERTEELTFLQERYCTQAQGYLLGRPQAASMASIL